MKWINYEIEKEYNGKIDFGLKYMRLLTYIVFYPFFYIVSGEKKC